MASRRRSARLSSLGPAISTTPTTNRRHVRRGWNNRITDDEPVEGSCSISIANAQSSSNLTSGVENASSEVNVDQILKTPKTKKVVVSSIKRELKNATNVPDEASPPKQSKHRNPIAQNVLSPSRLLDRLTINEITSDSDDASEDKDPLLQRNKYQNARCILNSGETKNLPGREEQLEELKQFFREHLENKRSGSLYVSGQPGTGKTACLSLLLHSSEFSLSLQRIYINCTSIASIGGVYKKLSSELKLKPQGRAEHDYMASIQYHIQNSKKMLLIVLDEIDQLCNTKQSILYTIFEWPSLPNARLLLVGIANSLDLTERTLTRLSARCDLKPKHMHFPPYTKQQIVNILKSRLEEADVLDIFPPLAIELLAARVSAVSGDVRRALDIGRRVVEMAEQQKKAGDKEMNLQKLTTEAVGNLENLCKDNSVTLKPVQVTHVAAVLNKVYGASQNLHEDIEQSFPLQQKIMLCSLMLMLRNQRNRDITIGRLHEIYRRVCNKRNIHSLDQAEFVGLVDLVQTRGILHIIKKKEPRLSKVQLSWDEEEVTAALCDKQLIASILDDTTCLSK
uniref:Cell division control protein n=1 Tax=Glossina brevipalpis TaxID=37001 RepID=A0A1A9X367_9MUSC